MNGHLDYADVFGRGGLTIVRLEKSLWVRSDGLEFTSLWAAIRN